VGGKTAKRLTIEYLPLDEIVRWPENPKAHAVDLIAGSIEAAGFDDPVGLNTHPDAAFLLEGHGRLKALAAMRDAGKPPPEHIATGKGGAWLVPVVKLHLPPGKAERYALAHNQLSAGAGWDDAALGKVLGRLADLNIDTSGLGWEQADIDALIGGASGKDGGEPGGGEEPPVDRAGELQAKWGTSLSQVWHCGPHRIVCGDCTDPAVIEAVMQGEKADLCLTDPPYGVGLDYDGHDDSETALRELAAKWLPLARNAARVVVFTPGVTQQWLYPEPQWVMCWFYGGGQHRGPWGFNCWQPIICYGKDQSQAAGLGCRPDAVDLNTPANAGDIAHPCPKPMQLWEWLVTRCSFGDSDIVLDPFLGSGTTMIACHRLGRVCRGIELSPAYVAVCLERYAMETGETPELATERP
jgi:hypothetical protein